jgi:hypothetical protein
MLLGALLTVVLPSEGLLPGRLLALGTLVFIAGRLVDLAWHATHK